MAPDDTIAAVVAETPPPIEPAAPVETKPEVEAEVKPAVVPKAEKPWYERRIDQLTGEKYANANRIAELERALAAQPAGPQIDEAEIDKRAGIRAAQISAAREFDAHCNEIHASGTAAYGDDFMRSVTMLNSLSGGAMPANLVEAAYESGRGADVLQALGKDPNVAMEVLTMPPVRMATRIAKMAAELAGTKPAPKVSKAPEPISPKVGVRTGGATPLADIQDTGEWMRQREKELRDKRANAL